MRTRTRRRTRRRGRSYADKDGGGGQGGGGGSCPDEEEAVGGPFLGVGPLHKHDNTDFTHPLLQRMSEVGVVPPLQRLRFPSSL